MLTQPSTPGTPAGQATELRSGASTLRRIADGLARAGFLLVVANAAIGLVGGAILSALWHRVELVGNLGAPMFLVLTGAYLVAMILSVPDFLVGAGMLVSGNPSGGVRRLLPLLGAFAVAFGFMLLSHSLIPCSTDTELPLPLWPPNNLTPWLCEYGGIREEYHIVHHTLVGTIPVLALYWLALRLWHPSVAKVR